MLEVSEPILGFNCISKMYCRCASRSFLQRYLTVSALLAMQQKSNAGAEMTNESANFIYFIREHGSWLLELIFSDD